jgi:twitching motility protein PilT
MESLIALSVTQKASDLYLCSGQTPTIRIDGKLKVLKQIILTHAQLDAYFRLFLSPTQLKKLMSNKQIDIAINDPVYGRYRMHIFYQYHGISAIFRFINATIPTIAQINLPPVVNEIITKSHGLILITGATGSGKSTSLAALIEHINQHQNKHIMTLEDPIEYIYQSKQSIIQQREINTHVENFSLALKAVLRQDPDIIVVGELRDDETIQTALTLAETGHLIFATLHTNTAYESLNRIIDIVAAERKNFVRAQLAVSLCAVIWQQLVAKPEGGREALYEVLINTPAISHLIREGNFNQIITQMQMGKQYGMQLMNNDELI